MGLYQIGTLVFFFELILINSLRKGERKAKLVRSQGWRKPLAEHSSRLFALRKGKESTKRDSLDAIQSPKARDAAACASSGEGFLENRTLCKEHEPLDSVETAALRCNYRIYQI